jgi:heterodisulfide reductase subunit B
MKYGLFMGCNTPAHRPDVEQAIRSSMPKLGVDLVDLEGYVCCPAFGTFPSSEEDAQLAVNAWNLSLAEEQGVDLAIQCGSCYSSLTMGSHLLEDEKRRERANELLKVAGRRYEGKARPRHVTDILYHEVGTAEISKRLTRSLEGLHGVIQYPCHTLYPSGVVGFEPARGRPKVMAELLEALGATVDHFSLEYQCCGGAGGFHKADAGASTGFLKDKLDAIERETQADFIVVSCITCLMWMDNQQKTLSTDEHAYSIPVFDLNQLLALCLDSPPEQVASISTIDRSPVVEKIRS